MSQNQSTLGFTQNGGDSAGFGLLDLLVGLTILAIGAGAMTTTLFSTRSLSQGQRERAIAMESAAGVMETLRATAFQDVFVSFDSLSSNDPAGAGTAPGASFDIDGLIPRSDDADGSVGSIEFPTIGSNLREDIDDAQLGMPRDLDFDGVIDTADHSSSYSVLPVRISVEWTGATGQQSLQLVTVLSDRS